MSRRPNLRKSAWAAHLVLLAVAAPPGLAVAQSHGSHEMGHRPRKAVPAAQQAQPPQQPPPQRPMADGPASDAATAPQQQGGTPQQPMDHDGSAHAGHGSPATQAPMQGTHDMQGMHGMDGMQGMKMGPMQGGRPPADARDPDAYAEGTHKSPMHGREMGMADDEPYGRLLVNELEYAGARGERDQRVNLEAWYGGDYDKLWLKAEGGRSGGRLDHFRTEALWDHAIAPFWSTQLGLRHDNGGGPSRDWLAFGVQGLAPYWFETEATAYIGSRGTLAARIEFSYDLLFTQRLILQPKIEASFYSRNDPERGLGAGLSDVEAGLRLRYETRRQFAPYIGVSWSRKFGNTARFARTAGEEARTTRIVAGVRIWF